MITAPETESHTKKANLMPALVVRNRRQERITQRRNQLRWSLQGCMGVAVLILGFFAIIVPIFLVSLVGLYMSYAAKLPPPSQIVTVRDQFETTRIYDRTGQTVLYEVLDPNGGDRQYIKITDVPRNMIMATIAAEDRSFYTNPGFDLRGLLRIAWLAVQDGPVQGASTITQQLVKNVLISPEERYVRSQDRKLKEIILATEISRLYSKDQILEWYLNTSFYGNLSYGVSAAAQVYFGKHVQELTLAEAAMLAAIVPNPSLNPIDNPELARRQQQAVLNSMVTINYITAEQAIAAASEPLIIQPLTQRFGIIAPHFSLYARQQAQNLLNAQGLDGDRLVAGGGLKIYTTLDLDLQFQVECVSKAYVTRIAGGGSTVTPNTADGRPCQAAKYLAAPPNFSLERVRNITNAAAVVIRPDTGEILCMMGSIDYWNTGIQGNFNAALGLRQPASAFKPFVYVTAFAAQDGRYMPATMVLDIPRTFNQDGIAYEPRNEDNQFHGPMTVRTALANSYNIPAVNVMADVGITRVLRTARQLGLSSLEPRNIGLALALGSSEVTLLDLTYAYTSFATLGSMAGTPVLTSHEGFRGVDPTAILRIEDKDGKILWSYDEQRGTFSKQSVLRDALAYLITNILSDEQSRLAEFGEGNALQLTRPAAAKTGTTNDNRDGWTVGYTPDLVTGVWVGNNDNQPMGDDVLGSTSAAPIWRAIMEYALRDKPVQTWQRPASIVEVAVCQISGLLPTEDCKRTRDLFIQDANVSTVPTQRDIYWKKLEINTRNGLLATSSTPTEYVENRQYFEVPPDALAWAKSVGWPLPPTEYDTAGAASITRSGTITSPAGFSLVRGVMELRGVIDKDNVATFNMEYGAGINPDSWVNIGGGDLNATGENVLLGMWNTIGLDGLYTLRLGLTLKSGRFEPQLLQVTVDNTPPTIKITSPAQNSTATVGQSVVLQADITDNYETITKVEFYHNGQLLATTNTAPYSAIWQVDSTGVHQFTIIAYDQAGNQAQSEPLLLNVRE